MKLQIFAALCDNSAVCAQVDKLAQRYGIAAGAGNPLICGRALTTGISQESSGRLTQWAFKTRVGRVMS